MYKKRTWNARLYKKLIDRPVHKKLKKLLFFFFNAIHLCSLPLLSPPITIIICWRLHHHPFYLSCSHLLPSSLTNICSVIHLSPSTIWQYIRHHYISNIYNLLKQPIWPNHANLLSTNWVLMFTVFFHQTRLQTCKILWFDSNWVPCFCFVFNFYSFRKWEGSEH